MIPIEMTDLIEGLENRLWDKIDSNIPSLIILDQSQYGIEQILQNNYHESGS